MRQPMCFLNFVFTDGENYVYELVKFSESKPMEFELSYLNEKELKELWESGKYTFDFGIRNNYLVWDGQSALKVSSVDLEKFMSKKQEFKSSIITIYDLFYDLIRMDGSFVSSKTAEFLDVITDTTTSSTTGVTKFRNLQVSKSTLNVYLHVFKEEGWKVRSFINVKDGVLTFTGFHFAVNEADRVFFESKYPVKYLKSGQINGKQVAIYYLDDELPIYPMFEPYFKICDPMLNEKVYISERDKCAIDFLSYFITSVMKSQFPDEGGQEEEGKEKQEYIPSEDRKYNVLFRFSCKQPNWEQKKEMLNVCTELFQSVTSEGWDLQRIMKSLDKHGYDHLKKYACLVAIKALASTNTSMLDRLECMKNLRSELQAGKIKTDLELFAYRAFIYFSDYKFPYNTENYFMTGGVAPYRTEIVKKVKGLT